MGEKTENFDKWTVLRAEAFVNHFLCKGMEVMKLKLFYSAAVHDSRSLAMYGFSADKFRTASQLFPMTPVKLGEEGKEQ